MNFYRFNFLLLVILVSSSLAACGSKPADDTPPAPVALVELQPAVTRSLSDRLTAYGTVDFSAAASNTVAVPVESQIQTLLTHAGARVRRGDPLLRLIPSPTTQLDFDKARRDAQLADAEVVRLRRLRDEGLATESEVQTAVNTAGTANALRNSLAERIGVGQRRVLRAPSDGVVDTLAVQPGDVLTAGAPAVRVLSSDGLRVRLGIEAVDIDRVAIGQAVQLRTLARTTTEAESRVDSVDARIDPQTRQAAAVVRIKAGDGIPPGAALRGDIVLATHAAAIAVPAAALLYVDDAPQLFVAIDGKAQKRAVKTGFSEAGFIEITEGLKAGEVVAVAGNAVLEEGMALRTEDAAKADAAPP